MPSRDYKEVIAALIFASGNPIEQKYILEKLPELSLAELKEIIAQLKETYSGDNGIILLEFKNKYQFASNEKYGDIVTEVLTELREKDLTNKVLETLAIIAYNQPITKAEIDDIRGSDSDYAVTILTKFQLIEITGRKEAIGRPFLYGTTDNFLKKFNLTKLEDLPDYQDVLDRTYAIYNPITTDLFVEKSLNEEENQTEKRARVEVKQEPKKVEIVDDMEITAEELPTFLDDNDEIKVFK